MGPSGMSCPYDEPHNMRVRERLIAGLVGATWAPLLKIVISRSEAGSAGLERARAPVFRGIFPCGYNHNDRAYSLRSNFPGMRASESTRMLILSPIGGKEEWSVKSGDRCFIGEARAASALTRNSSAVTISHLASPSWLPSAQCNKVCQERHSARTCRLLSAQHRRV